MLRFGVPPRLALALGVPPSSALALGVPPSSALGVSSFVLLFLAAISCSSAQLVNVEPSVDAPVNAAAVAPPVNSKSNPETSSEVFLFSFSTGNTDRNGVTYSGLIVFQKLHESSKDPHPNDTREKFRLWIRPPVAMETTADKCSDCRQSFVLSSDFFPLEVTTDGGQVVGVAADAKDAKSDLNLKRSVVHHLFPGNESLVIASIFGNCRTFVDQRKILTSSSISLDTCDNFLLSSSSSSSFIPVSMKTKYMFQEKLHKKEEKRQFRFLNESTSYMTYDTTDTDSLTGTDNRNDPIRQMNTVTKMKFLKKSTLEIINSFQMNGQEHQLQEGTMTTTKLGFEPIVKDVNEVVASKTIQSIEDRLTVNLDAIVRAFNNQPTIPAIIQDLLIPITEIFEVHDIKTLMPIISRILILTPNEGMSLKDLELRRDALFEVVSGAGGPDSIELVTKMLMKVIPLKGAPMGKVMETIARLNTAVQPKVEHLFPWIQVCQSLKVPAIQSLGGRMAFQSCLLAGGSWMETICKRDTEECKMLLGSRELKMFVKFVLDEFDDYENLCTEEKMLAFKVLGNLMVMPIASSKDIIPNKVKTSMGVSDLLDLLVYSLRKETDYQNWNVKMQAFMAYRKFSYDLGLEHGCDKHSMNGVSVQGNSCKFISKATSLLRSTIFDTAEATEMRAVALTFAYLGPKPLLSTGEIITMFNADPNKDFTVFIYSYIFGKANSDNHHTNLASTILPFLPQPPMKSLDFSSIFLSHLYLLKKQGGLEILSVPIPRGFHAFITPLLDYFNVHERVSNFGLRVQNPNFLIEISFKIFAEFQYRGHDLLSYWMTTKDFTKKDEMDELILGPMFREGSFDILSNFFHKETAFLHLDTFDRTLSPSLKLLLKELLQSSGKFNKIYQECMERFQSISTKISNKDITHDEREWREVIALIDSIKLDFNFQRLIFLPPLNSRKFYDPTGHSVSSDERLLLGIRFEGGFGFELDIKADVAEKKLDYFRFGLKFKSVPEVLIQKAVITKTNHQPFIWGSKMVHTAHSKVPLDYTIYFQMNNELQIFRLSDFIVGLQFKFPSTTFQAARVFKQLFKVNHSFHPKHCKSIHSQHACGMGWTGAELVEKLSMREILKKIKDAEYPYSNPKIAKNTKSSSGSHLMRFYRLLYGNDAATTIESGKMNANPIRIFDELNFSLLGLPFYSSLKTNRLETLGIPDAHNWQQISKDFEASNFYDLRFFHVHGETWKSKGPEDFHLKVRFTDKEKQCKDLIAAVDFSFIPEDIWTPEMKDYWKPAMKLNKFCRTYPISIEAELGKTSVFTMDLPSDSPPGNLEVFPFTIAWPTHAGASPWLRYFKTSSKLDQKFHGFLKVFEFPKSLEKLEPFVKTFKYDPTDLQKRLGHLLNLDLFVEVPKKSKLSPWQNIFNKNKPQKVKEKKSKDVYKVINANLHQTHPKEALEILLETENFGQDLFSPKTMSQVDFSLDLADIVKAINFEYIFRKDIDNMILKLLPLAYSELLMEPVYKVQSDKDLKTSFKFIPYCIHPGKKTSQICPLSSRKECLPITSIHLDFDVITSGYKSSGVTNLNFKTVIDIIMKYFYFSKSEILPKMIMETLEIPFGTGMSRKLNFLSNCYL